MTLLVVDFLINDFFLCLFELQRSFTLVLEAMDFSNVSQPGNLSRILCCFFVEWRRSTAEGSDSLSQIKATRNSVIKSGNDVMIKSKVIVEIRIKFIRLETKSCRILPLA